MVFKAYIAGYRRDKNRSLSGNNHEDIRVENSKRDLYKLC
jgi:hypothetical protein